MHSNLQMRTSLDQKGFTLVELAIVMIIIGLLIGGILQGQELIKQAQIRNTVQKIHDLNTAVETFRAKYDELPGDMTNATQYGIHRVKGTATSNLAKTANTNNEGDGDGVLEEATNGTYASWQGEMSNFFVMLSNSQMLKGNYGQTLNCQDSGTACNKLAGQAYPETAIGNGIIALTSEELLEYAMGVSSPLSALNAAENAAGSAAGNELTPEEAMGLDTKMDDGKPTQGNVKVFVRYNNGAFVNDTANIDDCDNVARTQYNLTSHVKECSLRILATN